MQRKQENIKASEKQLEISSGKITSTMHYKSPYIDETLKYRRLQNLELSLSLFNVEYYYGVINPKLTNLIDSVI